MYVETNAIIHLKKGLDCKSISQLYTETHVISHTRTRLLGDPIVNHVLDSRLQRESNYTRKNCVTTTAEHEYINALGSSTGAQLQVPNFEYEGGEKDKDKFVKEVKLEASTNLKYMNELKWKDHIKTLVQQGNFLDITSAQHEDIIWKSFMFDMKQGTLKFLLNASLDTLPTNANLFK